jgi:hypothetical protein
MEIVSGRGFSSFGSKDQAFSKESQLTVSGLSVAGRAVVLLLDGFTNVVVERPVLADGHLLGLADERVGEG